MKITRVQPSYIIQTKIFRDTSLLLEIFSRQQGRVSLIARGVRNIPTASKKIRRSRFQVLLQPFVPLLLSWQGRTDLYRLIAAESNGCIPMIKGQYLFYGWYLNELLTKLLVHADAHPDLFDVYQTTLQNLHQPHVSFYLRQFEKALLLTLGVMPELDRETQTAQPIDAKMCYRVLPGIGVIKQETIQKQIDVFDGAVLLATQCDTLQEVIPYLPHMKRLFRLFIDYALEGIKLHSRELMFLYTQNIKKYASTV